MTTNYSGTGIVDREPVHIDGGATQNLTVRAMTAHRPRLASNEIAAATTRTTTTAEATPPITTALLYWPLATILWV